MCKCCVIDWDLDGGNRTCSSWEFKVWISIGIILKWTFGIFGVSRICCMDPNKTFLIELSSASGMFSMEALVREIIPVVAEKYEFDNRDKSLTFSIFWIFWLPRLKWKAQKPWFINRIILHNCQAFDWDLCEWNQAYICWKIGLNIYENRCK